MVELQREIQTGDFRQVYLLYGEERFLVQQYKHRLVEALNPDECMKQKERNERRRNQNYKSGRCSLGARPAKGTGER